MLLPVLRTKKLGEGERKAYNSLVGKRKSGEKEKWGKGHDDDVV